MPSYDQGYQTGSKPGTVFLGVGPAYSDLAVDLSQSDTDMTDESTSVSEDPAERYNVSHPRTIHAQIDMSNSTDGHIFHQGSGAAVMRANGSGSIVLEVNGSAVQTISIDGLTGLERAYEVAWVSEANPGGAGSTAVASWLVAWDVASATAQRVGPFFHAEKDDDDGETRWGEEPGGGSAFDGDINRAGFHHRAMTLAEIYDDWISSASAPSGDASIEREPLPLSVASGQGDRNELQGPSGAWSAKHMQLLRRRTVTGRAIRLAAETLTSSHHTTNALTRIAVGSSDYLWRLGWLWVYPVPETISHVWVRVHADLWVTSGDAVPVGLRMYSATRPPQVNEPAGPYDQRFVGEVVTRDDGGSGAGSWTELGALQLERGEGGRAGWTYFMLAYAVDPAAASANDANARTIINAVHFSPHHQPPGAGEPQVPGESG